MTEPEFAPIVDSLILQVYYRTLGTVSIHTGISNIYKACEYLAATKRKGTLYWVVEHRIANWENLEVSPGITMTIRIFGSELRGKNTVLLRKGFFTSYIVDLPDLGIKRFALVFGTYKPPIGR
ncbi:MAG: hypothetical protein MUP55_02730 [Candidatus Aenigmarchaeota archaeon]|nr:hypothetical protein [Candidatus Aenigmarchaeota archaeon]